MSTRFFFIVVQHAREQRGFTLLELLVVISLLVAVTFIATGTFQGVIDTSDEQLVYSEMREIAGAIRQFRQDTGYYPGEGPFGLSPASGCSVSAVGAVDRSSLPLGAGADWFESPANFQQLFMKPALCSDHPLASLAEWDSETRRGWRGPYLDGFAEGYVDISNDINVSQSGVSGSPLEKEPPSTHLQDVPGIADPFEHRPETISGNSLLDWNAVYGDSNEREVWGRPYLYFYDVSAVVQRWLVSMGPDGDYDEDDDNIVLNIE